MSKLKSKILLTKVKTNSYRLRAQGQIPFELSKRIYNLTLEDSEDYVKYLMILTQHYMRTKGYYNIYKEVDKQASDDIRKGLLDKGYKID